MVRRNQGVLQPACQGTRTGRTSVDEVAGRASLALALGCNVRVRCSEGSGVFLVGSAPQPWG